MAAALESLLRREEASSSKEHLARLLLVPADPLIHVKAVYGLAQVEAEEALPLVAGLLDLDEEIYAQPVGHYLRRMREKSPEALRQALERLSPRALTAAEWLLQAPK